MKPLADKIRLLRLERGFSQENMADSLGISTTSYGDIERGKTDITLSRLMQIAEIYGITLLTLLGEAPTLELEIQHLELEKLKIENEKLRLENQYLREKLATRIIVDLIQDKDQTSQERRRIGF
ncbi:helix-turn-helix transcriptional regulator [Runella sp. MFBS21]|uniref:helix-turn-helix domain-containing protein n=1 Tax=Runella sp. MFBS21 TaxID=3034018 RepID=UPI0023F7B9CE|nr:helix-turn-helix transcriptional regulator [Runella sp. MFBS21]MDF7816476.1 helix-turn-helix transcriptional regulator [Runella sp. MFBS21]